MNKKGFTLIEILAAIVILGIVSAIGIAAVSNNIVESRKSTYVNLARDPSHANQVLPQGRKERMIGLDLEKQGKIGKIIRDPQKDKGAEFIDTITGIKWDVKSFVSHPKGATSARKGAFKLSRAIAKIEKEFANGHNVIIDTRRLTKSDRESLIKAISEKGYSDKIIWYHHKGE